MTRRKIIALALLLPLALLVCSCGHVESPDHKKDVTTWYEAFNTKDPALVDKILSANWDDIPPAPGQVPGRQGAKDILAQLATGFPDLKLMIKDVMQDGDKVIVRSEITGTQTGAFMGLSPKNRKISIQAIDIHQFVDGRIVRSWHTEDWMTAMRQLGVTMPAQSAIASGRDGPALPAAGSYALDPPHTFVYFTARHKIVGQVRGRFDKVTGAIVVGDPAASGVDVTIDAASVDTQNTVRDEDLRSGAFFDVSRYPTIAYRGKGIRHSASGWVLDGMLTIRGVTKSVPLKIEFRGPAPPESGKAARVAFRATASTKRAEFGMVRELLEEIGESATDDDVTIEIDAELLADKK